MPALHLKQLILRDIPHHCADNFPCSRIASSINGFEAVKKQQQFFKMLHGHLTIYRKERVRYRMDDIFLS